MALNCRSNDHPVPEPCGVCESCTEIRAGNSVDVIEIDAATNRGIDEIRELREAARYRPARDRFKIYILDEAHQITDAAFNALLKTLEEPPDHIVFMLATTQPEDIPQTIRSRCQHFSFRAVKFDDIVGQLRDLVTREKIEADEDALALLAEAGDGSMRDALSILDQAIASSTGRLTADSVRNLVGAAPAHILEQVMQAVSESKSEEILRQVDHLSAKGIVPRTSRGRWSAFCAMPPWRRSQARIRPCCRFRARNASAWPVSPTFSEEDLTRHLQIMLRTHGELGYKQEQRFHLELGLLKMAHAQRLMPIEQLLSDVGRGDRRTQRLAARPCDHPSYCRRDAPSRSPALAQIMFPRSLQIPRGKEHRDRRFLRLQFRFRATHRRRSQPPEPVSWVRPRPQPSAKPTLLRSPEKKRAILRTLPSQSLSRIRNRKQKSPRTSPRTLRRCLWIQSNACKAQSYRP